MYDELVKRLKSQCYDCKLWDGEKCCLKGDCSAHTRLDAADAIEELGKDLERLKEWEKFWEKEANEALKNFQTTVAKIPKWIPVTERLPDAGERVLCYCRANIYEVMKMRTDGDWVYDTNHVYMHSFVTHWMPLPEPPKEE